MNRKNPFVSSYAMDDKRSLRKFDGSRIAIVITHRGAATVLCGTARYVVRSSGNELAIRVEGEDATGHPTFLLQERTWQGQLVADVEFGCDWQLRLDVDSKPRDV